MFWRPSTLPCFAGPTQLRHCLPGQAGRRDPSAVLPVQPYGVKAVDLPALEAEGAAQERAFLEAWRGRVPSDLVIIYLGLIGRNDSLRDVAKDWRTDASTDVETLWAALDAHFPKHVLYPNTLAEEIDQRRFVIERVTGRHVRATALSGDPFDAPVTNASGGIIVGNLHKSPQGIRDADGTIRSLITLPLRLIDLTGHGHREASGIFRRFVETIASDCLWLGMANQQAALHDILDQAIQIDQATLEETERMLRDQLPTILAELKLPTETSRPSRPSPLPAGSRTARPPQRTAARTGGPQSEPVESGRDA